MTGKPSGAATGGGEAAPSEVTRLLAAVGAGDRAAIDRLFEVVYAELRRIAQRQLRGAVREETLSTTALVHEAYLKLSRDAGWSVRDRGHFFALAARAMRHVLVDHARHRGRAKRGGGAVPLSLDDALVPAPERAEELLALDGALDRLESADPELARLVEWRFFAGLSVEEVAELLEVSDRTVKRRWRAARAFLYRDLAAQGVAL
jgi:RNA polymerase sigma factor (TIGR02999 family)